MRLKIKDGEDSAVLDAHEKKTLHAAVGICNGLSRLCSGSELDHAKDAARVLRSLCAMFAPFSDGRAEATTAK